MNIVKVPIVMILLFGYERASSQITIRNMSLVKPDTNVLFKQIDNKIKVLGTSQKVRIVSQNGSGISSYDSNTFVIIPKTLTPDTLTLYDGQTLLLKKIFTIDTLPELSVCLGNIQGDTATISEVMANKALTAAFRGSLYYSPIRIISFTSLFTGPASDLLDYMITIQGNMLSKEQEAIIKQLKKGSTIYFDNILAVSADSKTRRLSPFTITIL